MFGWLDHRSGVRNLIGMMLLEGVPGGARWRYVWGSCLAFVFSIQLVTGILLMTAYSPSASQAWNSVHMIQYKMDFGWLVRGLHHFGSQTMMVLIALHMLQVVWAGAQLPPREFNWWTGIGLLSVTLGLSLTGYLLPWDQKGYWATDVATNIAGTLPEIGAEMKQQAVAGPDSGNHTLTRFYGLHVAILPLSLILLLVAHLYVFRRHGVTSSENQEGLVNKPENEHKPGTDPFWPKQMFFDMVACMAVFAVMMTLVMYGFAHKVDRPGLAEGEEPSLYQKWARAGCDGKGAELDAAADRDTAGYPARPEWYFLFLFQLLKYFPGDYAIFGTVIIPNGVMVILVLLPLFGYGPMRRFGHIVGVLYVVALLACVGMLTLKALDDDKPDGILGGILKNKDVNDPVAKAAIDKATHFQEEQHKAEIRARRACQLAMEGTPVEGGHVLIRNDPFIAGQDLFQKRCGGCHNFTAQETDKIKDSDKYKFESWTLGENAGDLGDFGTKQWVRGLLDNPMDKRYLGLVKRPKKEKKDEKDEVEVVVKDEKGNIVMEPGLTAMRGWRARVDKDRKAGKIDAKQQDADFDKIAELLAYLATPADARKDDLPENRKIIEEGQKAFFDDTKNKCSTCHSTTVGTFNEQTKKFVWAKEGDVTAPDLSGYGSAAWLRGMIMRPGHKSRYGERNLMPAFRNKEGLGFEVSLDEFREANEKLPESMIVPMPDVERELIIRWIQRDYRPIFGGTPIAK